VGSLVVAHEIRIAIGTSQLEVPILGRQPRVEHFRDVDTTVANDQRPRRLLAAVASVALDVNGVISLLTHPITTLVSGSNIA
jgi:DNA-binding cell septation regulator SpoVG